MRFAIAAIVFAWAGTPAQAQELYVVIPGIKVAPCTSGASVCGPGDVRAVPWVINRYRRDMKQLGPDEENYVPLSEAETTGLTALRDALLAKPSSGNPGAFPEIKVEYEYCKGNICDHADSSFDKLQAIVAAECTAGKVHSVSFATDRTERYGLIDFDCIKQPGPNTDVVSVAMQSGKPIRLYYGEPEKIYAPAPPKR